MRYGLKRYSLYVDLKKKYQFYTKNDKFPLLSYTYQGNPFREHPSIVDSREYPSPLPPGVIPLLYLLFFTNTFISQKDSSTF